MDSIFILIFFLFQTKEMFEASKSPYNFTERMDLRSMAGLIPTERIDTGSESGNNDDLIQYLGKLCLERGRLSEQEGYGSDFAADSIIMSYEECRKIVVNTSDDKPAREKMMQRAELLCREALKALKEKKIPPFINMKKEEEFRQSAKYKAIFSKLAEERNKMYIEDEKELREQTRKQCVKDGLDPKMIINDDIISEYCKPSNQRKQFFPNEKRQAIESDSDTHVQTLHKLSDKRKELNEEIQELQSKIMFFQANSNKEKEIFENSKKIEVKCINQIRSELQKVLKAKERIELEKKLASAMENKSALEFKYQDHFKEHKDLMGIHQARLHGKEEAFKQCSNKITELLEEGNLQDVINPEVDSNASDPLDFELQYSEDSESRDTLSHSRPNSPDRHSQSSQYLNLTEALNRTEGNVTIGECETTLPHDISENFALTNKGTILQQSFLKGKTIFLMNRNIVIKI